MKIARHDRPVPRLGDVAAELSRRSCRYPVLENLAAPPFQQRAAREVLSQKSVLPPVKLGVMVYTKRPAEVVARLESVPAFVAEADVGRLHVDRTAN